MRQMRTASRFLLAAAVVATVPACAPPGATEIGVSAEFGPGIDVFDYDAGYFGPWRTDYLLWTPTTVYVEGSHFYSTRVRGSRPVEVYRYRDQYFLPPRDHGWVNHDRRYDYKHRPSSKDYQRARPRAPRPGGGNNGRGNGRGGGG
jgi:hypothetical protein